MCPETNALKTYGNTSYFKTVNTSVASDNTKCYVDSNFDNKDDAKDLCLVTTYNTSLLKATSFNMCGTAWYLVTGCSGTGAYKDSYSSASLSSSNATGTWPTNAKYGDVFVEGSATEQVSGCDASKCITTCSCASGWTEGTAPNTSSYYQVTSTRGYGTSNVKKSCYKAKACPSGYYSSKPNTSYFVVSEKDGCYAPTGCVTGYGSQDAVSEFTTNLQGTVYYYMDSDGNLNGGMGCFAASGCPSGYSQVSTAINSSYISKGYVDYKETAYSGSSTPLRCAKCLSTATSGTLIAGMSDCYEAQCLAKTYFYVPNTGVGSTSYSQQIKLTLTSSENLPTGTQLGIAKVSAVAACYTSSGTIVSGTEKQETVYQSVVGYEGSKTLLSKTLSFKASSIVTCSSSSYTAKISNIIPEFTAYDSCKTETSIETTEQCSIGEEYFTSKPTVEGFIFTTLLSVSDISSSSNCYTVGCNLGYSNTVPTSGTYSTVTYTGPSGTTYKCYKSNCSSDAAYFRVGLSLSSTACNETGGFLYAVPNWTITNSSGKALSTGAVTIESVTDSWGAHTCDDKSTITAGGLHLNAKSCMGSDAAYHWLNNGASYYVNCDLADCCQASGTAIKSKSMVCTDDSKIQSGSYATSVMSPSGSYTPSVTVCDSEGMQHGDSYTFKFKDNFTGCEYTRNLTIQIVGGTSFQSVGGDELMPAN
jgi:hypothetical protein